MSEFQYYEWHTLDRPLTPAEQKAVNQLSSHIEVTPTNAVVTYEWGNFKHDPLAVLGNYFDAFLYFANWGTRQLAFRFPKELLDTLPLQPYLWEDRVDCLPGNDLLLVISRDDEGSDTWFEHEPRLATLVPLRDHILAGDCRCLYLAWLMAVEISDAVYEEPEPPVPPGLDPPAAPLAEFAGFFEIEPYLVRAAAQGAVQQAATGPGAEELIARLPRAECDAFLLRLAQGEPHLSLSLNRRLRELAGPVPQQDTAPRRTWGELCELANHLHQAEQRRQREAAEVARQHELQALAQREPQAWAEVDWWIEQKQASAYEKAVALLVQLRDLTVKEQRLPQFQSRLAAIKERNTRRVGLMNRLRRAKL